ncbi:hypothetical protein A3K63_01575 [Candidatus Micrarchaeota archaeon RBG_16_49_10]|nr:MAG: hypothetical protein A3K63_01575 [Candidatus Micrarchaeota archaeon RBG_16_49_10]
MLNMVEKTEFECKKCKKLFDNKPALEQHSKDKHINEPVFVVPKISKSYVIAGAVIILLVLGTGYLVVKSSVNEWIGRAAPGFTLPASNENEISLSDYSDEKNVLLFFHEGVGCAPCWQQIKDMQQSIQEFEDLNVEILSITVDSLRDQEAETDGMGITLPLLSDSDLSVSKAYDALTYSMHPGIRPGHTFILIDMNGAIRWRQDWYSGIMYVPVDNVLLSIRQSL